MFRGREQSRPELGFRLLQRLAGDVEELGFVESQPRQDGRNMIMVIGPHRRKSEARAERATRDAHHGERSRPRAASVAAPDANAGEPPAEAGEAAETTDATAAEEVRAQPEPATAAQPEPATAARAATARSGPARVAAASKASARS